MNRQELILLTRSQLGEPVVKVELDDTHFDTIFAHAKLWFRSRKGLVAAATIQLVPGKTDYDFPPDCDRVLEVVMPGRADFSNLTPGVTDLIPSWLYSGQGAGTYAFESSQHAQVLVALEQFKRVFSMESSWFEQHGKLWLSGGGSCSSGGQAMVFFRRQSFEIEELRGRDEDLFYRYVVAFSKRILARIRGKYPSYPAAGGPISMDADILLTEANEELVKLEEEIIASQGATPFSVG